MSVAGVLNMLLTALKPFGAAELLGQVRQHTAFFLFLFCRPLNVVMTSAFSGILMCLFDLHICSAQSNTANSQKQRS